MWCRVGFKFTFCYMDNQLPPHHLLKSLSFPSDLNYHLYHTLHVCVCRGGGEGISELSFLFDWSVCLSLNLFHPY